MEGLATGQYGQGAATATMTRSEEESALRTQVDGVEEVL